MFQCALRDSWQPAAGPDWQRSTSIYTALPIGTSQPRAQPQGPKAFIAVQGQPFTTATTDKLRIQILS